MKSKPKNKAADVAVPMNDDWQAKEDFQTIVRHHEIRKDKARHARAMAHGAKMAAVHAAEIGKAKK